MSSRTNYSFLANTLNVLAVAGLFFAGFVVRRFTVKSKHFKYLIGKILSPMYARSAPISEITATSSSA